MKLIVPGKGKGGSIAPVFDPSGLSTGGLKGFGDQLGYYLTSDIAGGAGTVTAWNEHYSSGPQLVSSSTFLATLDPLTTLDGLPALKFSSAASSRIASAALPNDQGDQPWAMFIYCIVTNPQPATNYMCMAAMARTDAGGGPQSTGALLSIMGAHDGGAAPYLQAWMLNGYDGRNVAGLSDNGDGWAGVRDYTEPVISISRRGTVPFLGLPLLLLALYHPQNGLRFFRNGRMVASMSLSQMALFGAVRMALTNTSIGFGAISRTLGFDSNMTACPDFQLYAGGFWNGQGCDTSEAMVDAFHAWAGKTFPSLMRGPAFVSLGSSLESAPVSGGLYTTSWIDGAFALVSGIGDFQNFSYAGGSLDLERGTNTSNASGNYSGMWGVSDGTNFLGTPTSPARNTSFENCFRASGLRFLTSNGMPVCLMFGGLATHDLDSPGLKTAVQVKAMIQKVLGWALARKERVVLWTVMGRGDRTQSPTNPNGSPAWTNASETESNTLRNDILTNWNLPLGQGGTGGYGGGTVVCDVWDLYGWLNSRGAPQDSVSVRNDAVGSGTYIRPDGVHQTQAAHNILMPLVAARINLLKTNRFLTSLAT